ncbi:hypothetical protein F3Y22_tig00110328pilonHSYRG00290 [Hibiscus syriacus]|uniref:Uncharacterized protein n=1 Tax=Hibiscus syriacus TaxID=106335 RepID=A0A6A3AYI5_HIBSY|nr:hypothetical protein F3Y22_tig00110328pilonHSYRG00290 [Hibiscus syriacus]
MPVLKVVLMTGVGGFIALDRIKLLGPEPNRHLNNVVHAIKSSAGTHFRFNTGLASHKNHYNSWPPSGHCHRLLFRRKCWDSHSDYDPSLCSLHARPYASLSLAIGAVYIWSYVYGIIRLYVNKGIQNDSTSEAVEESCTELDVLPSIDDDGIPLLPTSFNGTIAKGGNNSMYDLDHGVNLLRGLNGSDVSRTVIIGIIGVRNILLPLIGVGVVKEALH